MKADAKLVGDVKWLGRISAVAGAAYYGWEIGTQLRPLFYTIGFSGIHGGTLDVHVVNWSPVKAGDVILSGSGPGDATFSIAAPSDGYVASLSGPNWWWQGGCNGEWPALTLPNVDGLPGDSRPAVWFTHVTHDTTRCMGSDGNYHDVEEDTHVVTLFQPFDPGPIVPYPPPSTMNGAPVQNPSPGFIEPWPGPGGDASAFIQSLLDSVDAESVDDPSLKKWLAHEVDPEDYPGTATQDYWPPPPAPSQDDDKQCKDQYEAPEANVPEQAPDWTAGQSIAYFIRQRYQVTDPADLSSERLVNLNWGTARWGERHIRIRHGFGAGADARTRAALERPQTPQANLLYGANAWSYYEDLGVLPNSTVRCRQKVVVSLGDDRGVITSYAEAYVP